MDNRFGEMEVFARVAAASSFSAAARELAMTPSAVSRLISRLEDRLRVRLLVRSTRNLTLTPEGEAYLGEARALLDRLAEMEARLTDGAQNTPRGPLRVSSSVGFGASVLLPLVPRFLACYPDIQLDLTLTDEVIDLWQERADLAIRYGGLRNSALMARLIARARRIVVAAPSYLKHHGTPKVPADLLHHHCLCYNFRPDEWTFHDRKTGQSVRQPVHGPFKGSDGTILREVCLAGMGLMSTGEQIVARELADGRLVEVLADWAPLELEQVHAVFPGHPHLATRIRAFIDFLVEHAS